MNFSNRLRAIEVMMQGKPPAVRPIRELSDAELWAIVREGRPELPADVDQVSDETLAVIAGEES